MKEKRIITVPQSVYVRPRGERTHFDAFSKPVTAFRGDVTLAGGLYGKAVTFPGVTGTFIGCAVTLNAADRPVRYELIEAPKEGTIIQ